MTIEKRPRRKYPDDFKREAVALVTEQGYSIAAAARSLGISDGVLSRWKQEQALQASGVALSQDEREELRRLKRENRTLLMEKEILKKASAYFAREMQ